MYRSLIRVAFGFFIANLMCGVILTLGIFTPSVLVSKSDQIQNIIIIAFMTAIQCMLFSLIPGGIILIVCEWFTARSFITYVLSGSWLSASAYLIYFSNQSAASSILNDWAFIFLIIGGIIAGLTYWALAGRKAGK